MNKRLAVLLVAAGCVSLDRAMAAPPTTQADGFTQGKAYKPANADIKAGINDAAAAAVPGQNPATATDLKGLYGSPLVGPGQSKVIACSTYLPGSDAYKNQECDTINYVAGNASTRPVHTIDKMSDPLVVRSNNVRNTPEAHTTGTSGLSGSYTACTDKTTSQPERFDTERCQIGRPVTEAQCRAVLNVTYTWQRYSGQRGADLRYGHCGAGQVRGDHLTIPLHSAYRPEWVACASRGHGTGVELLIWHDDCTGKSTLHGYDAGACSIKPAPDKSDPPRQSVGSCTNAPRIDQNCFTPGGQFTDKVEAPIFRDVWDYSACADLNTHGAIIVN